MRGNFLSDSSSLAIFLVVSLTSVIIYCCPFMSYMIASRVRLLHLKVMCTQGKSVRMLEVLSKSTILLRVWCSVLFLPLINKGSGSKSRQFIWFSESNVDTPIFFRAYTSKSHESGTYALWQQSFAVDSSEGYQLGQTLQLRTRFSVSAWYKVCYNLYNWNNITNHSLHLHLHGFLLIVVVYMKALPSF